MRKMWQNSMQRFRNLTFQNFREQLLKRVEFGIATFSNIITVHHRAFTRQNSLLYLFRWRTTVTRLDRFREQFWIVLIDVRQLDRKIYRPTMVDIGSTKGTTFAPSGAIQTRDRVPAREQGCVEAAIHAYAAQHSVQ